ncbi:MAG: hypothetical protein KY467_05225 [Gemmatimonadetes bacterium]|nr:hypothetical protein [Gemmatimonadota bacterium]
MAHAGNALSTHRPHRAAMPRERVLDTMRHDAGPALCPASFAALEAAQRARPGLAMNRRPDAGTSP